MVIDDVTRDLYVAEVHAEARWVETGKPYVQDYVIWMTLGEDGRIRSWREYWDKDRLWPPTSVRLALAPFETARLVLEREP
ncbi:hypothetical protein OM076_42770 [Solirubrobacter ginsenosidimutans]|uniref:Nuclear transport factor 2 family protein n=1 Tax=Solirubrobacter ginsenosidimutans TaxID=490573 RepID=A0A9X3N1S4_9ACTN|nr:hypothetical protein [Solirubrobacter ginsenosidimutans]MDA0167061.1 hypothetical protein [Solirubrobacter ginsenosidimutans]